MSTTTTLSEVAWSKLGILTTFRKFIQTEIDHAHTLPKGVTIENLTKALHRIDTFSFEINKFLVASGAHPNSTYIESRYHELSTQYVVLMEEIERELIH